MGPSTQTFRFGEYRLAYDVRGSGGQTVVLVPGLLMTRRMQWPLADELAATGLKVYTFDPLGFGESDHPAQVEHYSIAKFADQLNVLLNHVGVERTVVYGTSLGSLITLEFAAAHPHRLHGLVVEAPVLERAVLGVMLFGGALLAYTTLVAPLATLAARMARQLPPGNPNRLPNWMIDWVGMDATARAAALQGIIRGKLGPARRERQAIELPMMVIGYRWFDPVHPDEDVVTLAADVAGAELLDVRTWMAMRHRPERLAPRIAQFIAQCPERTGRRVVPA